MELKPNRRPKMSSGEVVFLVLCLLAAPAAGQVRVSTIQEAIERWTPASHVYVMGDVGLEPDALAEMESSLAGGHWTVLLIQDATGQTFRDVDGATREGVDAIEYGTGQGIARAAGFAAQVHPKTGEPDGTILSIVLTQRALYYTGSKAQDDRGIGDAAFAGNLDRWAIEAMRNGGDIASAVRNTVTNVDNLLLSEIERAPREARVAIASAEESLRSLEEAGAALAAGPSHPAGSLAHPETRFLLEDLERARSQAETEPEAARELALDVLRRIGLQHEPIRRYSLAGPRFDSAWQTFRELHRRNPAGIADELLESARLSLVKGQALYRNADPAYADRLDQALARLADAQQAIDQAERRAKAEAAAHALLGFLAVCTGVSIAWGLNRWRAGAKEEAEGLRKSFEELTAELNTRAERATRGLDDLETAFTKLPELQVAIQGRARLLPVAQAALEEARRTMMDDPIRSLRETRRATRAVELLDRVPQVRSEITAGENRVEAARRELGALLGLDPWSLLREAGQAPSERLAGAARQADAARTALDSGNLDAAETALEQAKELTLEAAALVDRTLETGRSWEKEAGERRAETERLAGLVPEHQALAAQMQERFGQSDEALESGGLEAARGEIGVARHNLDAAAAAVREGRILAAAELLRKVAAHQERAGNGLAEIKNELDRLIQRALAAERARRQREEEEREARRQRAAQVLFGSSSSSSGSRSSGSSSGSGRSSWGGSRSGSGRSGW